MIYREDYIDPFDRDEFGEFEGLSVEEEDDERDKWECAFPSSCLMPGEHMAVECHTVEDIEAYYAEMEGVTPEIKETHQHDASSVRPSPQRLKGSRLW